MVFINIICSVSVIECYPYCLLSAIQLTISLDINPKLMALT